MSTVRSLPKRIPVLARLLGARRAVEVGTFTGYSAIAIARGLAADGGLPCCEANAEWAYQQAENANHWTRCLPGRSRQLGRKSARTSIGRLRAPRCGRTDT